MAPVEFYRPYRTQRALDLFYATNPLWREEWALAKRRAADEFEIPPKASDEPSVMSRIVGGLLVGALLGIIAIGLNELLE